MLDGKTNHRPNPASYRNPLPQDPWPVQVGRPILIAMLLVMLATVPGWAAGAAQTSKAPTALDEAPEIPWHVSAREMTYDKKADQYVAQGNVVISKLDRTITADEIRFNQTAMKAYAQGHVVMKVGADVLSGETMEIDLEAQTGRVDGGSIFLSQNNFHIRGDQIQKTGEQTYEIEHARISTCDGDNPDWEIQGDKVRVTVDGYGSIQGSTFRVKGVPLLYSPYLFFPAKVSRQSGLLTPQIGFSDRKGMEFVLPYYWAINERSDATFYEHFMSERGNKEIGRAHV